MRKKPLFLEAVIILCLCMSIVVIAANGASLTTVAFPILALAICVFDLVRRFQSLKSARESEMILATAHSAESVAMAESLLLAERGSAAKSRLLATASHEIRTPLSGILGMGDLLAQTRLTPEQKSYLDGIRQSGQALVQLVEDLLDVSAFDADRFAIHPQPEAPRRLIESVVEMLSHRAHEKGIEIGATVSADVPDSLIFDPARLRQVLFNVIGNAVKFTRTGGVLVRAGFHHSQDYDELVITIRDTGPGMTPEELSRIFQPFEQAGNAADKSAGTGLGLSISDRIMKALDGSMSATSEKGRGSLFTLRLPVEVPTDALYRRGMLANLSVLLLAPEGAASTAAASTIETLGGRCRLLGPDVDAKELTGLLSDPALSPKTLIVDHRMTDRFLSDFAEPIAQMAPSLRKIFLVNPEERGNSALNRFDAWLIRPLREQSLVDVLQGRFPIAGRRRKESGAEPARETAVQAIAPRTVNRSLDVLLAEDDPVNALLLSAALGKAGHRVRRVGDYEELLVALADSGQLPDLLLTDLFMPGGDGLEIINELRLRERLEMRRHLPLIVLTADHRPAIVAKALESGADLVHSKPIDHQKILIDIETLTLGATNEQRADVARI